MRLRWLLWPSAALLAVAGLVEWQAPSLGAGGILHPARRPVSAAPPDQCVEAVFAGAGVSLGGWRCTATASRRGTLVYLHGVADTRASAAGIVRRFTARGFDVIAYDSRAHGSSEGDFCSYGFEEKHDLRRVLETAAPGPVVVLGTSLGAAVALQAAAIEPRITAVVAAETFSDLRSVIEERTPFFVPSRHLNRAFAIVRARAGFAVDDVSPVAAASTITAPVFLIHGAADVATPPDHSRRVFAALRGRKRLLLVPGAGHNGSLQPHVWEQVADWIDEALPAATAARSSGPGI